MKLWHKGLSPPFGPFQRDSPPDSPPAFPALPAAHPEGNTHTATGSYHHRSYQDHHKQSIY